MGQLDYVADGVVNIKVVSAIWESAKAKLFQRKKANMHKRIRSVNLAPPLKNQDVQMSRSREDYLRRLGIQKDQNIPRLKADDYVEEKDSVKELALNEKARDTKEPEMTVVDVKNQKNFRISFLRKLSYEKVWVPNAQQSRNHKTILVFDWDDTLLCTSYLEMHHDHSLSDILRRTVKGIEMAVKGLLEMATRLGQTFIITNADAGWVEYSAAKWVPNLRSVLQKVHVISARTKYEKKFPGQRDKWKVQAFLELRKRFDSQIMANLISVGDSNCEMEAVQVMGEEFAHALIKTIKFLSNPSPDDLLKQLQLVAEKFERIVEAPHTWAIRTQRESWNPKHNWHFGRPQVSRGHIFLKTARG